jgi:hypothetical protein
VSAKPEGLSKSVDRAAVKLEEVADAAQAALALRRRAATESESAEGSRVVDGDADASWAIMRTRLEACAMLPNVPYGQAARARRILQALFGNDGLDFLRERYPIQYTLADIILKRIEADGLQAEIDSLAGPEYMENLRTQHERYRVMVQGILMRAQTDDENLLDHLRALQRAITTYATKVSATVEDDDPASADLARKVLMPIVNFRQQAARGRGSIADTAEAAEAAVSAEPAVAAAADKPPETPGSNEPT